MNGFFDLKDLIYIGVLLLGLGAAWAKLLAAQKSNNETCKRLEKSLSKSREALEKELDKKVNKELYNKSEESNTKNIQDLWTHVNDLMKKS